MEVSTVNFFVTVDPVLCVRVRIRLIFMVPPSVALLSVVLLLMAVFPILWLVLEVALVVAAMFSVRRAFRAILVVTAVFRRRTLVMRGHMLTPFLAMRIVMASHISVAGKPRTKNATSCGSLRK